MIDNLIVYISQESHDSHLINTITVAQRHLNVFTCRLPVRNIPTECFPDEYGISIIVVHIMYLQIYFPLDFFSLLCLS